MTKGESRFRGSEYKESLPHSAFQKWLTIAAIEDMLRTLKGRSLCSTIIIVLLAAVTFERAW